jgi:hypothetical protein
MEKFVPALILASLSLHVGCGLSDDSGSSSGSGCSGEVPEHGEDEAVGWKCISASSGGRVDIPDGAWLVVPPGALDSDQRIVVKVPSPSPAYGRYYTLEPSGLQFNTPVILHSPYYELPSGKPTPVTVIQSSESQPTVSAGSELTNWQYVETTERETETQTHAAHLEHFSSVYYFYQVDEHAYLTVDMPIKYLQAGDIMATLTNRDATEGPDWNPGHIGLVFELTEDGKIGQTIESGPPDGVGRSDLQAFKTDYGHLYLGARRPAEPPLTPEERTLILDYANQQLGKGYNVIGQGNFSVNTFSCVGLVEAAYDAANRGTMPWNGEFWAITPVEMFRATRPIDRLHEVAGEAITLPVYGVTLDADSPYFGTTVRGWYQREYDYTIAATSKPEKATFEGSPFSGYEFKWTPEVEDGCESTMNGQPCPADGNPHLLVLEMNATPRTTIAGGAKVALDPVTITETITLNVTSHSRIFTIAAAQPNDDYPITLSIPLPANAKFKSAALRDDTTKGQVNLTPVAGHSITIDSQGYNEQANAAQLVLTVTNATNQAGPASLGTWRYTLHYTRNRVLKLDG